MLSGNELSMNEMQKLVIKQKKQTLTKKSDGDCSNTQAVMIRERDSTRSVIFILQIEPLYPVTYGNKERLVKIEKECVMRVLQRAQARSKYLPKTVLHV